MTYHNAAAILADPATAVVERAPLTQAFEIVNNAVESRNTIPILSNARLQGDGSAIFITGTDLDLELTVAIPAAADSRFALTLPAGRMRDLLKKATASDFVAFTANDDGVATIDFERVKYRLQSLPMKDFPNLRGPSPLQRDLVTVDSTYRSFKMSGAAFWQAIDATMGAMSTKETRYYLNGIYMHVAHDGGLRFVATDGHRLYRQDMAAPDGSADMPGVILPRKSVALLYKLMKGKACPETVGIDVTSTKARFTWGDHGFHITLQTKLVDGTFPDYQRVIPSSHDHSAKFEPESMLEAIRAVSLISSERGRAVKMTMVAGKITLDVNNPEAGSAQADVAATWDGAAGFAVGYNAAYLVDVVSTASADGAEVTWQGTEAGNPAIFTGSREGWMAVLMPMRV
jgi:DNA polymerase-3 subunit beta